MTPCRVCGVDEDRLSVTDAVATIRSLGRRYREVFAGIDDAAVARRPDPDTWSMLEYAVHVREVLELVAAVLPEVLSGSRPEYPDIDPDAVAATRPPWVLDRSLALDGIAAAAAVLADAASAAPLSAWDRRFAVGGVERPASYLVRHAAHEGAHHRRDVERVRQQVT